MMARFLPLILFVVLGILLAVGLKIADTKTHIPSPLIGRPVPEFDLPTLYEPGRQVSQDDLLGEPYLVNFFGSWCPTCVYEHPVITDLAKMSSLRIVGLNFRDEPQDAMAWLSQHGDPYDDIIVDYSGEISIEFGVYAAPESFLVAPDGEVVYKHIGALTPEVITETILPMVEEMKRGNS
jgi:cytochrome c biogenesis protein CcmG/thiol:disulfide interchange protein DsbE